MLNAPTNTMTAISAALEWQHPHPPMGVPGKSLRGGQVTADISSPEADILLDSEQFKGLRGLFLICKKTSSPGGGDICSIDTLQPPMYF